MSSMCPIRLALVATVLGAASVFAQGSAPNQGAAQPSAPPILEQPPSVNPADITNGRPRPDTGGGGASTMPGTTAGVPIPSPADTAPEAGRAPEGDPARPDR